MKQKTLAFLEAHQSETPSKWREEAEWRRENASWLRHSQRIAAKVLLKMKDLHLTQKTLAERMNCTQQYVSKILKGKKRTFRSTQWQGLKKHWKSALFIRMSVSETRTSA